jgi:hypothetical protein
VGFGSKGLAQDAAVLAAFFPVFDKALELWPDRFPDEFLSFVNVGQGFFGLVHERAHGARVQVPTDLIKDWRNSACESSQGVAIGDPEWFREYWTGVESRGLKLPWGIYKLVHGDALPSPGTSDISSWRMDAQSVFELLCDFAAAVQRFQFADSWSHQRTKTKLILRRHSEI